MELKDKIKDLADKCLDGEMFFIVKVKVTAKSIQQKVLVTLDGDKGVTIDDCATLSRSLGDVLESSDLFDGPFDLEVSSPGADETIVDPRQYKKNLGRRLEIVNEDDETLIGKLESLTDEGIVILPETNKKKSNKEKDGPIALAIPYSKIKKSNVIISFK